MSHTPPTQPRIVVIGSINMDLVLRCPRFPKPGETLRGDSLTMSPGGKGANQAVAAARLGAQVTLVGRVGQDSFAPTLRNALSAAGVDLHHVHTTEGVSSGTAAIHVDHAGENAITLIAGANAHLAPDDIASAEPVIARADIVLVQLEIPLSTVICAIQTARRLGTRVILDPAPAPTCDPAMLPDELFHVDLISPNQSEAELLTGEPVHGLPEAKLVAPALLRRGPRQAVMKLGEHGALCVDSQGTMTHVHAFATSVIDTTGAGDAFTAGLAVGLAEGQSLPQATRMGCATGSLTVRQLGAQSAMPTRREVEAMLGRHC